MTIHDVIVGVYLLGALIGGIITMIAVNKSRSVFGQIFLILFGAACSWFTVLFTIIADKSADRDLNL